MKRPPNRIRLPASTSLVLVGWIAMGGATGLAQTQREAGQTDVLHLNGNPESDVLPEGALRGIDPGEWRGRGQPTTAEPGATVRDAGGTTTIYLGEPGRQRAPLVLENQAGETGITLGGGAPMSQEERLRRLAVENLERGDVLEGPPPVHAVDTTIHVESVTVINGSSVSEQRRNQSCVRIGTVGDAAPCN